MKTKGLVLLCLTLLISGCNEKQVEVPEQIIIELQMSSELAKTYGMPRMLRLIIIHLWY